MPRVTGARSITSDELVATASATTITIFPMTGIHHTNTFGTPSSRDQPMSLTSFPVGAATVVEVAGELDLLTAPELMKAIDLACERSELTALIIDLSRVEFLGSSGLGVLATLATRAIASDGPAVALRIVAPADHRPVVTPWEAMNLQQILPLHPSISAALGAG